MLIHETTIGAWVARVRAEYLEMPGLALTRWQMRRMWLMPPHVCDAVIEELVGARFLRQRPNDTYVRVGDDA